MTTVSSIIIRLQSVAAHGQIVDAKPFVNGRGQTIQKKQSKIMGIGAGEDMLSIIVEDEDPAKVAAALKLYPVGKAADLPVYPPMGSSKTGIYWKLRL